MSEKTQLDFIKKLEAFDLCGKTRLKVGESLYLDGDRNISMYNSNNLIIVKNLELGIELWINTLVHIVEYIVFYKTEDGRKPCFLYKNKGSEVLSEEVLTIFNEISKIKFKEESIIKLQNF